MTSYLVLCQDAVRESGTISGVLPASVTGQTGRLAKFVYWVARAWLEIQRTRADWLWMRGEWSATLSVDQGRYTATALGVTRWAEWVTDDETLYIYDPDVGVSDEAPLVFLPWRTFRHRYERGTQTADRPSHFSVSPAGELCFGPKPNKAYPASGEHRKTPQELTANADEPEMPARFHVAVSDYANILMAEHDEAGLHIATNTRRYTKTMGELERDQLTDVWIAAEPLA